MLSKPEITRIPRQPAAVIRLTIPRSEIRSVMGPGLRELHEVVEGQGIQITGPRYTHHFSQDPSRFDFEIGVPLAAPVLPTGRVQAGEISASRVLRTVYTGPYEKLGWAWGEFDRLAEEAGHATAGDLWEVYVSGPESGGDPEAYCTELYRPLLLP